MDFEKTNKNIQYRKKIIRLLLDFLFVVCILSALIGLSFLVPAEGYNKDIDRDRIGDLTYDEYVNIAKSKGVDESYIYPVWAVSTRRSHKEYGIALDPRYLLAIGLSENIKNPYAIGDNGCSYGAYQMNKCAGNGSRVYETHFGMKFTECAKNPYCSSKWTMNRIINTYKCEYEYPYYLSNYLSCLPRHNRYYYPQWYANKIAKNYYATQ